jgi:23S rRNA pseudouridine955/2504/2580 synthase/23S rRNA pseudouridine1911/1915/1917 synthase
MKPPTPAVPEKGGEPGIQAVPLHVRVIATRIDRRGHNRSVIQLLTTRFTYRNEAGWRERLAAGEFTIDGKPASPEDILQEGMTLQYHPSDLQEPEVDLRYNVCYEDDALLVIDKSGDLPVHPAGVFYYHTLWYLLAEKYGTIHPVNRLDRETSGLLVVARTPEAAAKLAADSWQKEYFALVNGHFTEVMDAEGALVRDTASPVRRKRKYIHGGTEGESCQTLLMPEQLFPSRSLVKAKLFTGRMHQIRATLYSLGYPLVGDKLYGADDALFIKRAKEGRLTDEDYLKLGMKRQALHSAALTFRHPKTGQEMTFHSPLPEDMIRACR